MEPLRRAINLLVALTLVALGGGGFVYFHFVNTSWPHWITIAAAIVGAGGLYWLWDEYINANRQP